MLGIAALVVSTVVAAGMLGHSFLVKGKPVAQVAPVRLAKADLQEPADASSEIAGKYYGLCEKNSVHSVEDFRSTVRKDPVLAAHFAGFNWDAAKLGTQDRDIWTFVSYRKGGEIRRTSKPVRLPKGDGYVTDGVSTVRTYCCNDYVSAPPPIEVGMASPPPLERVDGPQRRKPEEPGAASEPASGVAGEEPSGAARGAVGNAAGTAGAHFSGGRGYARYSSPLYIPTETTTIVTPEPGTFFLFGAGVSGFCLFRLLRRKRDKS